MALSSDEIIKREIVDFIGPTINNFFVRVFPEGSNDDQKKYEDGGLTFSYDQQDYGSCDCAYVKKDGSNEIPVIAIEGTDCLSRGSSGNAQYQRFHHALGAVKNKIIGVYYLRKGKHIIQSDLYEMAFNASKTYSTPYLIVQDLNVIKTILEKFNDKEYLDNYIEAYQTECHQIFMNKFNTEYSGSWDKFAENRSTIIYDEHIIKYSGRNFRNFTDSSQRAGHIAVGEMFLSKFFFPNKKIFYLWPRMTIDELVYLDKHKRTDKEWSLLRNEENVFIKTLDDIEKLPKGIRDQFLSLKYLPLKGKNKSQYNDLIKELRNLIINKDVNIN